MSISVNSTYFSYTTNYTSPDIIRAQSDSDHYCLGCPILTGSKGISNWNRCYRNISACARGRTDGKLRTYVPRREMAFLENHYVPRRKWSYCIPILYRVSDTGIIGFTVVYSHTIFKCRSKRGMCKSRIPGCKM